MTETYTPSAEELDRYRNRHEGLSVSGDGVFATLQGEGVTAGAPAIFLRLQDCNLHCGRGGIGWRCDAWYTWDKSMPEFWQERYNRSVDDITREIEDVWGETHEATNMPCRLVVTGGEPLLQQTNLLSLTQSLKDWHIEIETNGTVVPDERLANCQFNCSPKLETSGNSARARYRPAALSAIANMPNSWFKFVIANQEDEIEITRIINEIGIPVERVLLMSEGVESDILTERRPEVQEIATRIGGTAIERNHIFWFGDKRGT